MDDEIRLTTARLDELDAMAREAKERADKATPGPWRSTRSGAVLPPDDVDRGPEKRLLDPEILVAAGTVRECDANSAFVAGAREDVPALAAALLEATAEVRRLREEIDEMRHAAIEHAEARDARDAG